MIRPYLIGGAAMVLIGLTASSWWLGRELRQSQATIGAYSERIVNLNTEVRKCNAQGAALVALTGEWSRAYDSKVAQMQAEAAASYQSLRTRSVASCRAQYEAGVRYGIAYQKTRPDASLPDPADDGVRGEGDDLRTLWRGDTAEE